MLKRLNWDDVKDWLFEHWRIAALVSIGLLLTVGTVWLLVTGRPREDAAGIDYARGGSIKKAGDGEASSLIRSSASEGLVVDVKGAVRAPGMYRLPVGARLQDAISRAGGLADNADRDRINLAQPMVDGMVVYLPAVGGEAKPFFENAGSLPGGGGGSSGQPTDQSTGGKVSLNQASQKELEGLDGVGPKEAEQIIAYRREHPFQSIDQLRDISGIGEKRFEKLKVQVTL
ncbi:hypothetical protein G6R29_04345 [Fructobacillus sp. M2-14]|uniref:Helix-hairpin-helix DNA-binding motif class 1 domain-containing protein n=1 Tax=Fructobacillus broussonetiae TaxID=2713173 RepID=A0ABS5R078_9LACO|nr:ComEA family DNA-binding protein [Fructobacillus broussonetiae]MBS9338853.1 hypothetical protein [Fructobacillus broussonetiae]